MSLENTKVKGYGPLFKVGDIVAVNGHDRTKITNVYATEEGGFTYETELFADMFLSAEELTPCKARLDEFIQKNAEDKS